MLKKTLAGKFKEQNSLFYETVSTYSRIVRLRRAYARHRCPDIFLRPLHFCIHVNEPLFLQQIWTFGGVSSVMHITWSFFCNLWISFPTQNRTEFVPNLCNLRHFLFHLWQGIVCDSKASWKITLSYLFSYDNQT